MSAQVDARSQGGPLTGAVVDISIETTFSKADGQVGTSVQETTGAFSAPPPR